MDIVADLLKRRIRGRMKNLTYYERNAGTTLRISPKLFILTKNAPKSLLLGQILKTQYVYEFVALTYGSLPSANKLGPVFLK